MPVGMQPRVPHADPAPPTRNLLVRWAAETGCVSGAGGAPRGRKDAQCEIPVESLFMQQKNRLGGRLLGGLKNDGLPLSGIEQER